MFIKKEGKNNVFKNIVMPILAIIGSAFMVFAAAYAHGYVKFVEADKLGKFSCPVLFYLIVYIVIMAIGVVFYKKKNEIKK